MGRDSRHPFASKEVVFATKHEKEKILAPLFTELGLFLNPAQIDTDLLGTFSGEQPRKASVRDTLKAKIQMAADLHPSARFFLASEGSFIPHPFIGFINSNLETLLFFDKMENCEIYTEYLSTHVIAEEIEIDPHTNFQDFLKRNLFPSHGLIVRPADSFNTIYKGVRTEFELHQAILNCFMNSNNGKVLISTDQRAFQNPTRQKVIYQACLKMIESLNSLCPTCSYPGFSINDVINGLPCSECGFPAEIAKQVVYKCTKCKFIKVTDRPDGVHFTPPEQCQICNP